MKKYVTCELMGGLGNQLFQIFCVIAYSLKNNKNYVFTNSKQLNFGSAIRNTYWDNFLIELKNNTHSNIRIKK